MRSRRASNGSARPLNCGVMRRRFLIVACAVGLLVAAWLSNYRSGTTGVQLNEREQYNAAPVDSVDVASARPNEADESELTSEGNSLPPLASSDLASAFLLESRARTWAETAEAELNGRIAQATGLKLTNLRTECRERICRIAFTFPNVEYLRAPGAALVADALNGTPGFEAGGSIVDASDGEQIYYLQRSASAATK
jgi:hypothetical protein